MAAPVELRDIIGGLNEDQAFSNCRHFDRILQMPEWPVDQIIDLLKNDPEPEVRAGASLAVRWLRFPSALTILLTALNDPSPLVRACVVDGIGKLGDEGGYLPVLDVLRQDPSPNVRMAAVKSLTYLDPYDEAVPQSLLVAMVDQDASVRMMAISAFSESYDDDYVDLLIKALHDEDREVRERAANLLAVTAVERADEVERAALAHPEDHIRASYITGLAGYHYARKCASPRAAEIILSALQNPSPVIRASAARAFAELENPPDLAPLRHLLDDEDVQVLCAAMESLGSLQDEESFDRIVSYLRSSIPRLRYWAASVLRSWSNQRAADPLVELLSDESWMVRLEAASALAWIRDARAIEPLRTLGNHVSARVRWRAVGALSCFDDEVRDAMMKALQDADSRIRMIAIGWMGWHSDSSTVEQLAGLLYDENKQISSYAQHSLGWIGSPQAVRVLAEALKDEELQLDAASTLASVHDPSLVEPFIEALQSPSPTLRMNAARALGLSSDSRAVDPLISALTGDRFADVRSAAADALGLFEEPCIIDALIAALDDPAVSVVESAVWSLAKPGAEKALEPLIARLDKSEYSHVGGAILAALGKIGGTHAIDTLIEIACDPESELHDSAIDALKESDDSRALAFLANRCQDQD